MGKAAAAIAKLLEVLVRRASRRFESQGSMVLRRCEKRVDRVTESEQAANISSKSLPENGPELKDSIAERPNHSNLCTSEFAQNSVRIQEKFSQFFRTSENLRTSLHFLECSAKFRENFIKIGAKFY